MEEAVAHLALSQLCPSARERLVSAGYTAVDDFARASVEDLMLNAGVTREEAGIVLRCVNGGWRSLLCTDAASLHDEAVLKQRCTQANNTQSSQAEAPCTHIPTFSQALDDALQGGVRRGTVTEVAGPPGAGKTQLAVQLALTASLPPELLGGIGGTVLYVDTEGSVMPARCRQMARGLVDHVRGLSLSGSVAAEIEAMTVEAAVDNVAVLRVFDLPQLLAVVHSLPDLLQEAPLRVQGKDRAKECCLVVVDSIAFNFRSDASAYAKRAQLLASLHLALRQVASASNAAVVVVNQATTGQDSQLSPALGSLWAHAAHTRLWLTKRGNAEHRVATVTKTIDCPQAEAVFVICDDGVRDLDEPPSQNNNSRQQHDVVAAMR